MIALLAIGAYANAMDENSKKYFSPISQKISAAMAPVWENYLTINPNNMVITKPTDELEKVFKENPNAINTPMQGCEFTKGSPFIGGLYKGNKLTFLDHAIEQGIPKLVKLGVKYGSNVDKETIRRAIDISQYSRVSFEEHRKTFKKIFNILLRKYTSNGATDFADKQLYKDFSQDINKCNSTVKPLFMDDLNGDVGARKSIKRKLEQVYPSQLYDKEKENKVELEDKLEPKNKIPHKNKN